MSLHDTMLNNARRLVAAGKFKDARAILGEVLRLRPDSLDALEVGWAIAELTQLYGDAPAMFQRAIVARPDAPGLHHSLALALLSAGRPAEALAPVRRAIELTPAEARNFMLQGRILLALGKVEEGFESMRAATALEPGVARYWYNYGGLLLHNGRPAQGAEALRRAVAIEPANPMYLAELGRAILKSGSAAEALDVISKAFRLDPRSPKAAALLGLTKVEVGQGEEGCALLRRSLELNPEDPENRGLFLMNLNYVSDDGAMMRAEHRAFGERMERAAATLPPVATGLDPGRRLRVGFMSADLRRHSCSHFLLPLFEFLDRKRFEVWGIATTSQADQVTEQFRGLADGWICIALHPYLAAAGAIREAGIDILIECSGHTDGSRLDVCAAKPAPVQMTFLGYPNTTGLRRIDYRLVDEVTDPPGAEAFAEERLLRVPGCLWCFRPSAEAPEPGPAPFLTSPAGRVTVGCFNNLSKFSGAAVRAWAEILKQAPRADLLVKNNRLHDPYTLALFREQFGRLGVDPARVGAVPYTKSIADHLRVYERVDFQVDTFPYNGTTTTCESLWQGVPVLAVKGRVHAAKVSESLLHAAGLDDWITSDPDDYVSRAVALAQEPSPLAQLRKSLRGQIEASFIRDERGYCHRFEGVLRAAWERKCAENSG